MSRQEIEGRRYAPAPWKIRPTIPEPDDGGVICAIVAADTSTVCDVFEPFDLEHEGNATLIASAPELLEAARNAAELIAFWRQTGSQPGPDAEQALLAAIAKAEAHA